MTNIYTSLKKFHHHEMTILYAFRHLNFNLYKFKCICDFELEEGFKIEFTQTVTKEDIQFFFKGLKGMFNIGCAYLEHNDFKGCILKYLED